MQQMVMIEEDEPSIPDALEPTHESIDLPIKTSETIGEGL